MSTPSVQRSPSDVVVPTTSTPPEKFKVPGGRSEAQPAAQPEKQRTVVPNSSFEALKRWNEGPLRQMADDAIKAAGGSHLSPQDKEALRRNIMVLTQGGDFDQEGVTQAVKGLIAGLRDPQKAEAIRSDLWTQQAQAFGGMYVPDQYKQAVRSRLEGASGEPSPEAPVVPEGDETADVPVDTQETPAEGEAAPVESKPTPTASRSGAKTAKEVLTDEWAKLSAGKDAIVLAAMMPVLEKTGIPKESEPKVADLLRQQGIDPGKITQPQYMQARVELLRMALTRMASQQNPNASPEEIAGMVNGRLEVALNQTTI